MSMNRMADALERGSLSEMQRIPKSDLHNHAGRGGHVSYIADWAGVDIPPPPRVFASLDQMQEWYTMTIKSHCVGLEGALKRWEAAFVQAERDTISVLSLSFAPGERAILETMGDFIAVLSGMNAAFAPDTRFLPELTFDRACDVDLEYSLLDEIFSHHFFKSVDIACNELAQPITHFKKIFRLAKANGLTLKAHVGEFGTCDDVMEAVEELELQQVHHGIAAAHSPQIMKWLADHKIQLNVCPTSNIMLGLAHDYASHPIKRLYDAGVPVTVNTDDLLIFNQTVSQEYFNLYNAGLFTPGELDDIRETGLNNR